MSPMSHLPDELLADPMYSRLKEYLIESTGLTYYADKDAVLAGRVRRRLSNFGFRDCSSYLELLRDPHRGASEMDALVEEVTIGESYFFRHSAHFDALRDLVLPDLIARNSRTQSLRIWCAGCADGAEPYSLSILLRRELAHLLFGWEVAILGTDINRQSLAIAREGRFEAWSLRATPENLKQACFSKHEKHWTITPEYKVGISFQFHNLAEHSFPPQVGDPSSFDLIICRNVMIYFGAELMHRIVRQFHACLAPGAWLVVGPSEPNMTFFTSFHAVNALGVTLYQRPAKSAPDVIPRWTSPGYPSLVPVLAPSVESPTAISMESRPVPTLEDLRKCANQGDLENAARYGKELIESDKLNALVHFHYALVMEQMGNATESERSFRRAIYLDRQSVLPHYHLGRLLQSRGDWRQAARCFDNAVNLLDVLPNDSVLTDADGITVAELRKLAHAQVESFKERV